MSFALNDFSLATQPAKWVDVAPAIWSVPPAAAAIRVISVEPCALKSNGQAKEGCLVVVHILLMYSEHNRLPKQYSGNGTRCLLLKQLVKSQKESRFFNKIFWIPDKVHASISAFSARELFTPIGITFGDLKTDMILWGVSTRNDVGPKAEVLNDLGNLLLQYGVMINSTHGSAVLGEVAGKRSMIQVKAHVHEQAHRIAHGEPLIAEFPSWDDLAAMSTDMVGNVDRKVFDAAIAKTTSDLLKFCGLNVTPTAHYILNPVEWTVELEGEYIVRNRKGEENVHVLKSFASHVTLSGALEEASKEFARKFTSAHALLSSAATGEVLGRYRLYTDALDCVNGDEVTHAPTREFVELRPAEGHPLHPEPYHPCSPPMLRGKPVKGFPFKLSEELPEKIFLTEEDGTFKFSRGNQLGDKALDLVANQLAEKEVPPINGLAFLRSSFSLPPSNGPIGKWEGTAADREAAVEIFKVASKPTPEVVDTPPLTPTSPQSPEPKAEDPEVPLPPLALSVREGSVVVEPAHVCGICEAVECYKQPCCIGYICATCIVASYREQERIRCPFCRHDFPQPPARSRPDDGSDMLPADVDNDVIELIDRNPSPPPAVDPLGFYSTANRAAMAQIQSQCGDSPLDMLTFTVIKAIKDVAREGWFNIFVTGDMFDHPVFAQSKARILGLAGVTPLTAESDIDNKVLLVIGGSKKVQLWRHKIQDVACLLAISPMRGDETCVTIPTAYSAGDYGLQVATTGFHTTTVDNHKGTWRMAGTQPFNGALQTFDASGTLVLTTSSAIPYSEMIPHTNWAFQRFDNDLMRLCDRRIPFALWRRKLNVHNGCVDEAKTLMAFRNHTQAVVRSVYSRVHQKFSPMGVPNDVISDSVQHAYEQFQASREGQVLGAAGWIHRIRDLHQFLSGPEGEFYLRLLVGLLLLLIICTLIPSWWFFWCLAAVVGGGYGYANRYDLFSVTGETVFSPIIEEVFKSYGGIPAAIFVHVAEAPWWRIDRLLIHIALSKLPLPLAIITHAAINAYVVKRFAATHWFALIAFLAAVLVALQFGPVINNWAYPPPPPTGIELFREIVREAVYNGRVAGADYLVPAEEGVVVAFRWLRRLLDPRA